MIAAVVVLYLILLVTPVRLPFGSEAAEAVARSALPPTADLELGQMALAVENGVWPVIKFSPVEVTDSKSGAQVDMDALELGFSPIHALFGQPGVTVTVVGPRAEIVQDLYGPRTTNFEIEQDLDGGLPIVRVHEGEDAFPTIGISSRGIDFSASSQALQMRSDNDWLIYNMEAAEKSIADLLSQADQGRFSKLMVRDGTVAMMDAVYGLYREVDDIDLEIGTKPNERTVAGSFSASLGGRAMMGSISRTLDDDGAAHLEADVTNLDFAAIFPFLDDASALAALRGTGSLSIDVNFSPQDSKVVDGRFKIDATGLDLRIADSYFPIVSSIMDVAWSPGDARFTLSDTAIQVGQSSAYLSGIFAMGLDKTYGPTLSMMLKARKVMLHPNDLPAPEQPFDSIEFSGWSASLYGALGIDRLVAHKGDARIEARGRLDVLQAGMGVDMSLAGEKATADDLKRLWPFVLGTASRDWLVANVDDGLVSKAQLRFRFPVGSLGVKGENKPIPKGAMQIDMVGTGVAVRPAPEMMPVVLDGETRLQVDDTKVTVSASAGKLETDAGAVQVSNPAVVMDNSNPTESVIEVSGDVSAPIPAVLDLVREQQPQLLENSELPIDLAAVTGSVDVGVVATINLADDTTGKPVDIDYVLNGTVSDFTSQKPIQDRQIGNGQLAFSVSQESYQLGGTAEIDGFPAEIDVQGTPETDPLLRVSADMEIADLAAMGFDLSTFLSGKVRFVAQPLPDGSMQIAVDLQNAGVVFKDLNIRKAPGTSGIMGATVRQDGTLTDFSNIELRFGSVFANGSVVYDIEKGVQSAEFPQFGLSEGDSAKLKLVPIDGGFSVDIDGRQLDLKPMLGRFFSLGEGSGGVEATQIDQVIDLRIKLDRAIGYYATTAFNADLALRLRGTDLRRANVSAQFNEGNGISITTNPAPNGRRLSVAFNDAGTVLRFLGVYSQLAGGSGSLILTTDSEQEAETGQLLMRRFAIVDEDKVAEVLGNHADSRAAIAQENRLDFDVAQVDFLRRSDRVEVLQGMLTGATVGGTLRGFIYTDKREYDLTGTYVPLFGLNNAFQKIPIIGQILGGRNGEGLVGVTFAVQGPLNKPQFLINPLSALVPGAFRELFEFRAKEQPQAQQ